MSIGVSLEVDLTGDLRVKTVKGPSLSTTMGAVGEGAIGEDVLPLTSPDLPVGFALIEGPEEVVQSLRLRMATLEGEDPFFPTVGLPGPQMMGVFDEDFIAGAVRACILTDPRVERVNSVTVQFAPGDREKRIATVTASVRLRDGRNVNLESPVGL